MGRQVYALLVGINDYPPGVDKLAGCLADVDRFGICLGRHVNDAAALAVEVLKDQEATRANIIARFRSHLGQAGAGDVALFQFCGHGARSASSPEFRTIDTSGKDEGVVCFDSRSPGGHDLADKELAVLVSEVAARQAHMVVLLDCCHSGSGTRHTGATSGLRPRFTQEVRVERPLETYLDGHYARMLDRGEPMSIPTGRRALLAACDRGELALESADRGGVFTSALVDVLNESGGALSYADLFERCRAAVRTRVRNQTPQMEPLDGFDTSGGFLGREVGPRSHRYTVAFERGAWRANGGAFDGIPSAPEAEVGFMVYRQGGAGEFLGTATARSVGAQQSELQMSFPGEQGTRYSASVNCLPAAPLAVGFVGDAGFRRAIQTAFDQDRFLQVVLTDDGAAAPYVITADSDNVTLRQPDRSWPLCRLPRHAFEPPRKPSKLLSTLQHISQWERALSLQNPQTGLDGSRLDFAYAELLDNGGEQMHTDEKMTLHIEKVATEVRQARAVLKVRNRTGQTLHVLLLALTDCFGITVLRNDPIESGDRWMTLTGGRPGDFLNSAPGVDDCVLNFKLIVATLRIDDFVLAQADLVIGAEPTEPSVARALNSIKPQRKLREDIDWFTRSSCIRVVRQ